jgi:Toprim domain
MNAADIAHTLGDARREGRGWCCCCPLRGSRSVRLGAPRASEWLAIESLETALSVAAARAVPGWAGLSAGSIRSLVLPNEATRQIICADHDASGVSERAARDAAARWLGEGWRVKLALSPRSGFDFNDILRGAPTQIEEAQHVAG